jgi:urease accessory protein
MTRLLTWLSPAFPVGGYSYSHGIETAVEAGLVRDMPALIDWITGILRYGAGRNDAILLEVAWRAQTDGDAMLLAEALDWGEAFRGSGELALESAGQGRAFLEAVRAAWPDARLDALAALAAERDRVPAYPVAVGAALAIAGIAADAACRAFLHALAANLVSAAVRLIPLGQSDGLRVLAALEGTVAAVAAETSGLALADLGSAAWMGDLCSARHETQYTRLFRS